METGCGLHKKVYIFSKLVIKTPRFAHIIEVLLSDMSLYCKFKTCFYKMWRSYGEVVSEHLFYIFGSRADKLLLLPTYGIPFIPLTIQPRAKILFDKDKIQMFREMVEGLRKDGAIDQFSDIRTGNVGVYKGTVVKIDYGFSYIVVNVMIDIKNVFKKIANKIFCQ